MLNKATRSSDLIVIWLVGGGWGHSHSVKTWANNLNSFVKTFEWNEMTVAFFTVTKNLLQKVINVTSADLSRSWLTKDAETLETLSINKHLIFEWVFKRLWVHQLNYKSKNPLYFKNCNVANFTLLNNG